MATRAEILAQRVEQGAQNYLAAVEGLSPDQWKTLCRNEQRTVGVLVHHVGTMYPLEADVVRTLAADGSMPGLDWDAVDGINAEHATANADVDMETAIALVRTNVGIAAEAVRNLTDEQLDRTDRAELECTVDRPILCRTTPDRPSVPSPRKHHQGAWPLGPHDHNSVADSVRS